MVAIVPYFNFTDCKQRKDNLEKTVEWLRKERLDYLIYECETETSKLDGFDNVVFQRGDVMWQKERLLNIGFQDAVHDGAEFLMYVDADAYSGTTGFANKIYQGFKEFDVFQPFETVEQQYNDVVYHTDCFSKTGKLTATGFSWCFRASFLQDVWCFDESIVGSGDVNWAAATYKPEFLKKQYKNKYSDKLIKRLIEWADRWHEKVKNPGYVKGVDLIALAHGNRRDRGFEYRDALLSRFDPERDLVHVEGAPYMWSDKAPEYVKRPIANYFKRRGD